MRRVMDFFMYVFSACAEVVPPKSTGTQYSSSILRVRGGSSVVSLSIGAKEWYSPRARR